MRHTIIIHAVRFPFTTHSVLHTVLLTTEGVQSINPFNRAPASPSLFYLRLVFAIALQNMPKTLLQHPTHVQHGRALTRAIKAAGQRAVCILQRCTYGGGASMGAWACQTAAAAPSCGPSRCSPPLLPPFLPPSSSHSSPPTPFPPLHPLPTLSLSLPLSSHPPPPLLLLS